MKARWYDAYGGGLGLEVQRDSGSDWRIYGLVTKNRGCWDAVLNRQEESYSLGTFAAQRQAKDYLLKRSGAELVESEQVGGAR